MLMTFKTEAGTVHSLPWQRDNIKAYLFDFGGTLDADGVTWQDRFYPLYRKHGLDIDRERFRHAFYFADDSLKEIMPTQKAGLRETLEAQTAKVWEALALEPSDRQRLAIVDDFLDGMKWHIKRNRKILESLGSENPLGIISNFYGNLDMVCKDLKIEDLFVCALDSTIEGITKPDPGIFQAALARLSVRPDQAVYIGDNIYRDMEGAKSIGMHHIFLAGEHQYDAKPCCPQDPVIHSLEELGPLLLKGS